MRFKKRVKVFPEFQLDFSASGTRSKANSFNITKRGTYSNTSKNETELLIEDVSKFKVAAINERNNASLAELKELLSEVYNDRIELSKEIGSTRISLTASEIVHVLSYFFLLGFFVKFFREARNEKRDYLEDLEQQRSNSQINIDLHFDATFHRKYESVVESYKGLQASRVIWDITSSVEQDRKATRSAASHVVSRVPVSFKLDSINIVHSSHEALHLENKNGGDLYIYPGFVIMTSNRRDFALIDLKDLDIVLSPQSFVEEEKVPSDAAVIGKTWAKVNKNGTPDRRFKDNYEIPIVRYGQIDVRSATGLNEVYSVSNYEAAERFVRALNDYQDLLKN